MVSPDEENEPSEPTPEPGSFSTLFQRNRERFVRIARRMKARSPAVERGAETMDYVQDASAEYLKKERDVHSESHFLNLFAGFLKNAFRGNRRKRTAQKRGGGSVEGELPTSGGLEGALTGPHTHAARRESEDVVLERLAQLRSEDQRLITLRLWDEMSWEQIAEMLQLESPDAARKRYARALERLEKVVPEV